MALPLVPFAAGVAVGSLATLGVTDNPVRDRIVHGAQDLYARIVGGAQSVVAMLPKIGQKDVDLSGLTEAAEQVTEQVEVAAADVTNVVKKTRSRMSDKAAEIHG
jgi:predicted ATP-grasp superfamily ATP-dependent carboligase